MSANSNIEWTEATWNPIAGCTPNSPGCLNCYAAKMSHRLEGMGQAKYAGLTVLHNARRTFNGQISFDEAALTVPLRRKKPTMYFVNSMSDLFHEAVPFEFVDRVFAVMALCPQHTFQVLTKRPERMAEYTVSRSKSSKYFESACPVGYALRWEHDGTSHPLVRYPLRNVWLGCSPVNQKTLDEYVPHLLRTPAAVRFLSLEPLIGPVDLLRVDARGFGGPKGHKVDCIRKGHWSETWGFVNHSDMHVKFGSLDWIIVGGESGPEARPCNVAWARSVVEQCRTAGVPVFVKQLGSHVVDANDTGDNTPLADNAPLTVRIRLRDKKGGDPVEWPEDLRVREMPRTAEVSR